MRVTITLTVIGFCVNAIFAQGTFSSHFRVSWSSTHFQADFTVPMTDMVPGSTWSADDLYGPLTISDPLGREFHYGGSASDDFSGAVDSRGFWTFGGTLIDYERELMVVFGGGVQNGAVEEFDLWGSHTVALWADSGAWTGSIVPEPSYGSFVWLAAVVSVLWQIKRKRGSGWLRE